MTFRSIAGVAGTAALAGLNNGGSNTETKLMSKSELKASAIGRIAEMNIIQPKKKSTGIGLQTKEKQGIGLTKQDYKTIGRLGTMTALIRGGGLSNTGNIINEII